MINRQFQTIEQSAGCRTIYWTGRTRGRWSYACGDTTRCFYYYFLLIPSIVEYESVNQLLLKCDVTCTSTSRDIFNCPSDWSPAIVNYTLFPSLRCACPLGIVIFNKNQSEIYPFIFSNWSAKPSFYENNLQIVIENASTCVFLCPLLITIYDNRAKDYYLQPIDLLWRSTTL